MLRASLLTNLERFRQQANGKHPREWDPNLLDQAVKDLPDPQVPSFDNDVTQSPCPFLDRVHSQFVLDCTKHEPKISREAIRDRILENCPCKQLDGIDECNLQQYNEKPKRIFRAIQRFKLCVYSQDRHGMYRRFTGHNKARSDHAERYEAMFHLEEGKPNHIAAHYKYDPNDEPSMATDGETVADDSLRDIQEQHLAGDDSTTESVDSFYSSAVVDIRTLLGNRKFTEEQIDDQLQALHAFLSSKSKEEIAVWFEELRGIKKPAAMTVAKTPNNRFQPVTPEEDTPSFDNRSASVASKNGRNKIDSLVFNNTNNGKKAPPPATKAVHFEGNVAQPVQEKMPASGVADGAVGSAHDVDGTPVAHAKKATVTSIMDAASGVNDTGLRRRKQDLDIAEDTAAPVWEQTTEPKQREDLPKDTELKDDSTTTTKQPNYSMFAQTIKWYCSVVALIAGGCKMAEGSDMVVSLGDWFLLFSSFGGLLSAVPLLPTYLVTIALVGVLGVDVYLTWMLVGIAVCFGWHYFLP